MEYDMDVKKKVGERVRELRNIRQISQEDLAHKANLDRTYINSIENGRRNVSIINVERITKALNVTLAEFFDTEGFKQVE
jgi:transcriptional regulator with XRE-family HTH domain